MVNTRINVEIWWDFSGVMRIDIGSYSFDGVQNDFWEISPNNFPYVDNFESAQIVLNMETLFNYFSEASIISVKLVCNPNYFYNLIIEDTLIHQQIGYFTYIRDLDSFKLHAGIENVSTDSSSGLISLNGNNTRYKDGYEVHVVGRSEKYKIIWSSIGMVGDSTYTPIYKLQSSVGHSLICPESLLSN